MNKKQMAGKGPRYCKQKIPREIVHIHFFLVGVFLFNLSVRIFHHVNMCHLIHRNIKQVTPGDEPIPSHHIPPPKTGGVSAKKLPRSKKLNLQCPEALTSPMIA